MENQWARCNQQRLTQFRRMLLPNRAKVRVIFVRLGLVLLQMARMLTSSQDRRRLSAKRAVSEELQFKPDAWCIWLSFLLRKVADPGATRSDAADHIKFRRGTIDVQYLEHQSPFGWPFATALNGSNASRSKFSLISRLVRNGRAVRP